ncbi:MAG: CHRD domain-containing protein [Thermoleophilia bacterium]|nr:CHRD domain-containing protein [Thermoleophilia bacterium]
MVALTGVIALLGVGSYAIAGSGSKNFRGSPLYGYEENPDVSSGAGGSFSARLSDVGQSIHYRLSYSGLEGTVTQSHVHFGKPAVNGGISFFLCGTAGFQPPAPAPAPPTCPQSGTVEDDIVAADVIGPAGQGIEAGNLAEILAAMRAGHAYANVHSTKWPGGEIRAQLDTRGSGGLLGGDDEGDDD